MILVFMKIYIVKKKKMESDAENVIYLLLGY